MNLYVIRHGQTKWNNTHKLQGKKDIKLNRIGVKEAKNVKKILDNIKFDICYVSPLKRAIKTAEIIKPNCEITIMPELIERDFGNYEGMRTENIKDILISQWDIKLNSDDNNIESVKEVLKRTDKVKKEILSNEVENILIVSHGSTLKALHFNLIGYNEKTDFAAFHIENCEIYKYVIENNNISCEKYK